MSDVVRIVTDDGVLDEAIFTNASIHFEAMDHNQWWIGIDLPDGSHYMINCGAVSPRTKGYAHIELVA